jgi:hypothetical protein
VREWRAAARHLHDEAHDGRGGALVDVAVVRRLVKGVVEGELVLLRVPREVHLPTHNLRLSLARSLSLSLALSRTDAAPLSLALRSVGRGQTVPACIHLCSLSNYLSADQNINRS